MLRSFVEEYQQMKQQNYRHLILNQTELMQIQKLILPDFLKFQIDSCALNVSWGDKFSSKQRNNHHIYIGAVNLHRMRLIILMFFLSLGFFAGAQTGNKRPIQFSGVTVSSDSMRAVPFVTILVKSNPRGAISNDRGYFNFVAVEGDTVHFSAIGYKNNFTIIPNKVEALSFSILEVMEKDTFALEEVAVYPWPSKEDFKSAFLNLKLSEEFETARKNLEQKLIASLASQMSMDASENHRYFMQMQMQKMYYAGGQQPYNYIGNPNGGGIPIPSTFLSPIAWTQFFNAIKRGDFKKK